MPNLILWNDFTREDAHNIFSSETKFTPQAGTWGLQGIVRAPARHGDWVFFVTFGQHQGDHVFDESITDDGVLSWQSQPAQALSNPIIRQLIQHDEQVNSIHLFLRTESRAPYTYLGKLKYLRHDALREKPVHFQWQLLDWPAPKEVLDRINLVPIAVTPKPEDELPSQPQGLTMSSPPTPAPPRQGVSTNDFRRKKAPDYALQDARNRALGLRGELLVLEHEKTLLINAGRSDLAEHIVHVSIVEGDAAGYDIRSFEVDGRSRYIEVKTTLGDARTAFFISPNELAFSASNPTAYFLYRLYDFDRDTNSAGAYVLNGNVADRLNLVPTAFRAAPRATFDS
jgi:Domain of unknown function (DUF3883)/Domain of unknown function (DUF3427)